MWYEYVLTSYPGQSTAEKITIMPTEQPIEATLTEAEAVAQALENDALNGDMSIYTILFVSYDTNSRLWSVHVKDAMSPEEEITIEVRDH
uniref:PepSY domain-containing protein n=1 Tax=Anaerobacillus isosaccharinicus TaxID=1532552 RepID=A0A1S2LB01_9BACI